MKTMKEMKAYLKETAVKIKEAKKQRKGATYGFVEVLDSYNPQINLRYQYRHHHIAYSLLRGRTMEQIERTCREDNKPNEDYYNLLMIPIIRIKREEELLQNVA